MGRATTRRKEFDLARVREAVEAAEQATSAEIVVSIAPFFLGSVWRTATRAFARIGVANTCARNGVLVFVVPARHQVVVLADEGAHARLAPSVWDEVARQIATACGCGDGTAGVIGGIERLARELAGPFPHEPGDVNQLPDLDRPAPPEARR